MKRLFSLFIAALMLLPCIVNAASLQILQTSERNTFDADYVLAFNPSTNKNDVKATGSVTNVKNADANFADDTYLSRDRVIQPTEEQQTLLSEQMAKGAVGTRTVYSVGDKRTWIAVDDDMGEHVLNFECVAVGEHCYIWSVTDEGQYPLKPELAEPLRDEFEEKFPLMQEAFGDYYTPDGSGMIHLLCYDILDGASNPAYGWTAGYFYAWDMMESTNYASILHIDSYFMEHGDTEYEYSVIVHEFQHLINYSASGKPMDAWLDECMSLQAQEICYYNSALSDYIDIWNSSIFSQVDKGMSHFRFDDSYDAYCTQLLFGQYLYHQTGSYTVFRRILDLFAEGKTEIEAVEEALEGTVLEGMTIDQVIMYYRTAIVCKQPTGLFGFGGDARMDKLKNNPVKGKQMLHGCGGVVYQTKSGVYTIPTDAVEGIVYVPIIDNVPVIPEDTPIESVTIVTEDETPVYNEEQSAHLDYTFDEVVHFEEVAHAWYDEQDETSDFEKFLPNHTYSQYWEFKAEEGYTFAENTAAFVNYSEELIDPNRTGVNGDGNFCVWTKKQYAADTDADYARLVRFENVTVIPPLGGQCGKYTDCTLVDSQKMKITSAYWYNVTDFLAMGENEVFAADKEYMLFINVETIEGYEFAENPLCYINGSQENLNSVMHDDGNYTKIKVSTRPARAVECPIQGKAFLVNSRNEQYETGLYSVELRTGEYNLIDTFGGSKWLCMEEVGGKYYAYTEDGEFIVVNAETNKVLLTKKPQGIMGTNDMAYNTDDSQLYTADAANNSINVVNTESGAQHKAIWLDFSPMALAYADGFFYTLNVETAEVIKVDTEGNCEVLCTIDSYSLCGAPTMEYNQKDFTLYLLGSECISDEEGRRSFTAAIAMDGTYTVTEADAEFSCLNFEKDEYAAIGFVAVEGVSLSTREIVLYDSGEGSSFQLETIMIPANATNGSVTWMCVYPNIVTVEDGLATAHSAGLAAIVVQTVEGGFLDACKVEVIHRALEYTVTFVDGMTDEVIGTQTVEEGSDVQFPEAPEHEGYTFTGWDKDGKNITADTTITALYEEIVEPIEVMYGDVNGDGKINTADAVVILKFAAEMITLDDVKTLAGDTNHDGKVNTADAVLILKYAAGMISAF